MDSPTRKENISTFFLAFALIRFVTILYSLRQATVFEVADKAMVAVDYAAPKGRTFSQVT